ncbi:phage holin family protein [Limosilactobacillus reuteri]|uniref:Holin n=1 Tax=Limosilactobacillus reuteri TaxID=1598 RepID=A0A256VMW0_LIMRT|nr:phage holin family protein [Limosilactobacillus reuteri]OYS60523.1 holin [Limosilactobacillus reuteri]OYS62147.1 holin [Limosilactobacillus reuteri]OYS65362.1 holin [Limosilactobacillus reuteri]OYS73549.1 holin [Limosilactobacillus reuteri]OYS75678.1 holin [Limosilactobacillus reuteri]
MHLLAVAPVPPYHQLYFQHFQGMEDNQIIWLFVWVVIIDIVTGFAKSVITHHTTSSKGTAGLIKHGILLLVTLTLYPMLELNGMKNAADTFVGFYIMFYAVSIIENWGQMGLPVPEWLKKYIYKLSDQYKEEKRHENTKRYH